MTLKKSHVKGHGTTTEENLGDASPMRRQESVLKTSFLL